MEVVKYRDMEKILGDFNVPLGLTIIIAWFVLWSFMIMEKLSYSRVGINVALSILVHVLNVNLHTSLYVWL